MGFKYFLFHGVVHLLFVAAIFFVFNLNFFNLFLVFLSAVLIDVDHFFYLKEVGPDRWLREHLIFHVPRRYPLHNFLTLILFFIFSALILSESFFILGACSLSVALHLLWDFFEDAAIFKIGIKHWKP